jgi:hypothetical protein
MAVLMQLLQTHLTELLLVSGIVLSLLNLCAEELYRVTKDGGVAVWIVVMLRLTVVNQAHHLDLAFMLWLMLDLMLHDTNGFGKSLAVC